MTVEKDPKPALTLRKQLGVHGLFAELLPKVATSGLLKVAYGIVALVLAALLARVLGPSGYGQYSYALAVVTLLAIPVQFGLPTLLVRETARYQLGQEWGKLKGLLRFANVATLLITCLVLSVAGLIYAAYGDRSESEGSTVLLVALGLLPLIALGNLRGAALRGLGFVIKGQLPEMIFRPALFLAVLLITLAVGHVTPVTAMSAHLMAALLSFLLATLLLRANIPAGVASANPSFSIRPWLLTILPLSFISGMQVINSQVDVLSLGLLKSSSEVGIYKVAATGAIQVPFALSLINAVFAPQFVRLTQSGQLNDLKVLARKASRLSFICALPLVAAFALYGQTIISVVFGDQYSDAYLPLVILAFAQLLSAAGGSINMLLTMMGHEKDVALGIGIATLVNVGLNFLLIPAYGTVGAAIATAISLVAWRLLLLQFVRRRLV